MMPFLLLLMSLFSGDPNEFTRYMMIQGVKCRKINTQAPTLINVLLYTSFGSFFASHRPFEISQQSQHKLVGQT